MKDAPEKNFIALGSDYAWGRSSIGTFEEQIKAVGKNLTDKIFTPVGNKDYSTYIAKVIQSGAQKGMQSLDATLKDLVRRQVIAADEAYAHALDKVPFERLMVAREAA